MQKRILTDVTGVSKYFHHLNDGWQRGIIVTNDP